MAGVLKRASPVGVRTRKGAYGSRAACEEDSDSTKWSRDLPADASSGAQPEGGMDAAAASTSRRAAFSVARPRCPAPWPPRVLLCSMHDL